MSHALHFKIGCSLFVISTFAIGKESETFPTATLGLKAASNFANPHLNELFGCSGDEEICRLILDAPHWSTGALTKLTPWLHSNAWWCRSTPDVKWNHDNDDTKLEWNVTETEWSQQMFHALYVIGMNRDSARFKAWQDEVAMLYTQTWANIANARTVGFKPYKFLGSPQVREFNQGGLRLTDRLLDIAIQGIGFFQLAGSDGSRVYTRDGRFHLNAQNQIVHADGLALTPQIRIPSGASLQEIRRDGSVIATKNGMEEKIGQILLADFADPTQLTSKDGRFFTANNTSGAPLIFQPKAEMRDTSLYQRVLEESTVSEVEQGVNLLSLAALTAASTGNIAGMEKLVRTRFEFLLRPELEDSQH